MLVKQNMDVFFNRSLILSLMITASYKIKASAATCQVRNQGIRFRAGRHLKQLARKPSSAVGSSSGTLQGQDFHRYNWDNKQAQDTVLLLGRFLLRFQIFVIPIDHTLIHVFAFFDGIGASVGTVVISHPDNFFPEPPESIINFL